MQKVVLLRHGESTWNLENRFTGWTDVDLTEQGRAEAHSAGVLLNVVDRPELCDFIMPSIVQRGELTIATSTGGASPAMARHIRQELEENFGPEYALALTIFRRLRESLASSPHTRTERQRIFNALVVGPWVHGGWSRWDGAALGRVQFGEHAADARQGIEGFVRARVGDAAYEGGRFVLTSGHEERFRLEKLEGVHEGGISHSNSVTAHKLASIHSLRGGASLQEQSEARDTGPH